MNAGVGAPASSLVQGQSPWPAWRLDAHDKLPSTSDLCVERARCRRARRARDPGAHPDRWPRQPWPCLGFSAGQPVSVGADPPESPAVNAARWSLIAGLATIEALSAHVPDASGLQLKWPNDVTLWQAKLAGVLIESAARADQMLDWLVIGVGAKPCQRADSARSTGCQPLRYWARSRTGTGRGDPARAAYPLAPTTGGGGLRAGPRGVARARSSAWLSDFHQFP